MEPRLKVILASALDVYEELTAEIYVDDEFVGLINAEAGEENLVFEFQPRETTLYVPLAMLEASLQRARERLEGRISH